jgi:hypothetical protein
MCSEPLKTVLKRLCIVIAFSIAFAYVEAAVVVYLRQIFHPAGFSFPLAGFASSAFWDRLVLTEVGREAATLVIILASSWLFGRSLGQRFAFFLAIFAVWDIFFYLWLKLLLDWPASLMDWDILFLIPVTWAGPVLAPLLVSFTLLVFSIIILYRCSCGVPIKQSRIDWLGFILAALAVAVSFCIAGRGVTEPNFRSYFYWPLFALGLVSAIALFIRRTSGGFIRRNS